MIYILTSKMGDKYDHRHVNLLYSSIEKNYGKEFKFICVTDNPNYLNSKIEVIIAEEEFKYAFNKVQFFKDNFANIPLGSQAVIMDIDIEVVNDPSPVFDYVINNNTIGCFHKWWQYPYRNCFIWGGIYRFKTGTTQRIYDRLRENPEFYYKRYMELYNYKIIEKLNQNTIKGEQDFVLESLTVYNYHIHLFPSFYSETMQPEIFYNEVTFEDAIESPYSLRKPRAQAHFSIKSFNRKDRAKLIFNHYSGLQDDYVRGLS
jgi:hypothetical protein